MFSRKSFSNFCSSVARYCKDAWHAFFHSDSDPPPSNERDNHSPISSPSPPPQSIKEITENGILPSYCAHDDIENKDYTTLAKHMRKISFSHSSHDEDSNKETPPLLSDYVDMAKELNLPQRKESTDHKTCLTKKTPWYACIFTLFCCKKADDTDDDENAEHYKGNQHYYHNNTNTNTDYYYSPYSKHS